MKGVRWSRFDLLSKTRLPLRFSLPTAHYPRGNFIWGCRIFKHHVKGVGPKGSNHLPMSLVKGGRWPFGWRGIHTSQIWSVCAKILWLDSQNFPPTPVVCWVCCVGPIFRAIFQVMQGHWFGARPDWFQDPQALGILSSNMWFPWLFLGFRIGVCYRRWFLSTTWACPLGPQPLWWRLPQMANKRLDSCKGVASSEWVFPLFSSRSSLNKLVVIRPVCSPLPLD